MIWVVFALLTGAAVFAVLWPLSRVPRPVDRRDLDVDFYRAQTAEIERDAARGLIAADDVSSARTEAARRLVQANRRAPAAADGRSPWPSRIAAIAVLVLVPACALALYERIGAPNFPDLPLEARLDGDPAKMDMATIVARIERNVRRNPNDGRGWGLLARIYSRIGREADSANAYRNEIRVLGANEERLSGLGEAETAANGGKLTAEARADFDRALLLDPKSPRSRFYVGLAAEQAGDKMKAITIWKQLAADSPSDAPWLPAVKARIAAVSGEPAPVSKAGQDTTQSKLASAVAAMPAADQQAMIHRMVQGLADRLKTNGGDIDGWLKLVRAYRVLDEPDKAKVALGDARRNFASDEAATKRLKALAQELGLEG